MISTNYTTINLILFDMKVLAYLKKMAHCLKTVMKRKVSQRLEDVIGQFFFLNKSSLGRNLLVLSLSEFSVDCLFGLLRVYKKCCLLER